MQSTWEKNDIQILTDLWEGGKPASQIADVLGRTRNSVISKANRLRLSPRQSPIKSPCKIPKRGKGNFEKRTGAPYYNRTLKPKAVKTHEYGFTFEEAINLKGCLFALDIGFCGMERDGKHSFCEMHKGRVYNK